MSNSGDQEYPLATWYRGGEASAPLPVQVPQYAPETGQSPQHPWRRAIPYYIGTVTNQTNTLGSVGPPPHPQQVNGYNPQRFRPMFSDGLKRMFYERMAHADSEIVGVHRETCGPGRSRYVVTFETPDGA